MGDELKPANVRYEGKGDGTVVITFMQGGEEFSVRVDREGLEQLIGGLRKARDLEDLREGS